MTDHTGSPSPEEDSSPPPSHQEQQQQQQEGAAEDMAVDEPAKEEELTLTDHLNKKLLSSFLARLESGEMQLPPNAQQQGDQDEYEQEFEDS